MMEKHLTPYRQIVDLTNLPQPMLPCDEIQRTCIQDGKHSLSLSNKPRGHRVWSSNYYLVALCIYLQHHHCKWIQIKTHVTTTGSGRSDALAARQTSRVHADTFSVHSKLLPPQTFISRNIHFYNTDNKCNSRSSEHKLF